jgi:antitoxin (DNA-binding transcriptional repressor) of toxin-antitoxin stability system
MSTTSVDIQELPAKLAEILSMTRGGAEVILVDGSVPGAKLVPFNPDQPRIPGLHAGAIDATYDFDAPLPDDSWTGTPSLMEEADHVQD